MKQETRIINRKSGNLIACCIMINMLFAVVGFADGMPDDEPRARRADPMPEVQRYEPPAPAPVADERAALQYPDDEEWCEWKSRVSLGAPVWFFDEEDTEVGVGGYMDFWRTDIPLNYRIGIEGRHIKLEQPNADYAKEWADKTTEITYLRIPIAVEYMRALSESTTFYLGGGPNIIHAANDISDTTVGAHVSARFHQAFNSRWGMAIEGGYMWGEIEGQPSDVVLDGAFVTPSITYTF